MSTASTGVSTTSPFRQPKAVWAVAFACVISFMGIGLVDPILPALAQQLHASADQVALLFTSYLLVTAVMMLVTGWVSSRIGAKSTLVAGLVIIVAFAALAGLSDSVGGIVGFRAGWGLGNALFIATSLAVIVASASGGFSGAIILYETALGVGIALGPLVGGLLGSVSWRAPFFGVAVLMAIALVATLVLLDKTPRPAERISLLDPLKALRHRNLATIAVTAFAYNWGFFTLLAYSPYFMGGLHELALGAVFTGWGVLVAIFAVFVAPALERRFGTVRVVYVVLALMAVDLVVIAVWQQVPAVVITAVILAGTMIGLNNTLVTQAVMSVAPVPRPVAAASYSFVRFLGGGLAPWIGGLIGKALLPDVPFYMAAGVVAVGLVVLTTAHRSLRAVERGEPDAGVVPGGDGAVVPSAPLASDPVSAVRPVLVAVDDAPHADAVVTAGGRLARLLDAPAVLVHVPESAAVGTAEADRPEDGSALGSRRDRLRAEGVDVEVSTLTPAAGHEAVGAELVRLARLRDARAVVVGSPHGGPLSALAHPSAAEALWSDGSCPVVVVPPGWTDGSADVPARPAPTVSVRGHVRDAAGLGVRAVLTLMDAHGHQVARAESDHEGRYTLVAVRVEGPASGLLLARGRSRGAAPVVSVVTLTEDLTHDVVLESTSARRDRVVMGN